MAKFVAIEEDGPNKVTFAMVREDGSLVVQARYFGNDGYAGHEEVGLLPMGVKKLLELLSVTQPNTGLQSDGAKALANDEPVTWKCPRCAQVNPIMVGREYLNECLNCHVPILGDGV